MQRNSRYQGRTKNYVKDPQKGPGTMLNETDEEQCRQAPMQRIIETDGNNADKHQCKGSLKQTGTMQRNNETKHWGFEDKVADSLAK